MPSVPDQSRLRLVPILLAQGFGVACGIAGVKVNSLLLPPAVLGVYGVFLTFAPIGMWVVHAGLLKFANRHWAAAPARPALLRALVAAWARRLPVLAVAAIVGALVVGRLAHLSPWIIAPALFLSAGFLAGGAIGQSALQAERAHWRDCSVSVVGSLSRTFLPPVSFVIFAGAMPALWGGFATHTALVALTTAWFFRDYWHGDAQDDAPKPKLTSAYAGPLFTALALSNWVLAGSNRWIVAWFFGETEAGYFTLAGGAAVVLSSTLGAVFVQYFQPGIFALADREAAHRPAVARRVDFIAAAYTVAALSAVGAFACFAPLLVGTLIGENYRASLAWILPAGCFGTATIATVYYQALLLAGQRERACGPVELTGAAVLLTGSLATAAAGADWFARWLIATPLVPWLVTRPLARGYYFRPDAASKPSPAR